MRLRWLAQHLIPTCNLRARTVQGIELGEPRQKAFAGGAIAHDTVACLRLSKLAGVRMPMPIHELEAEVLALAAEDRARILEGLIKSFEPDSTTRKAWVAEALRREADVRAGRVALVPGNEAMARVRARIA